MLTPSDAGDNNESNGIQIIWPKLELLYFCTTATNCVRSSDAAWRMKNTVFITIINK